MTTSTARENWESDLGYMHLVASSISIGPARHIDYFKTSPTIWLSMLQGLRSVLALVNETTTSAGLEP